MRVAIVGCGPKGLFALERLLAHSSTAGEALAIEVFEPHPAPGAGPVYAPDQPDFLRMNFSSSQIDMWWRGDGPAVEGSRDHFQDWRGSSIDDYAPRAQVGRYLADGLSRLIRGAPPATRITMHATAVRSIDRTAGGWRLRDEAGEFLVCEQILLSTGHVPLSSGAMTAATDGVPAAASVAVRGFALTFIDAALALTEGRGGRFVPAAGNPGKLTYFDAPGATKRILPFSRTGRPMLAKPDPGIDEHLLVSEGVAAKGRLAISSLTTPIGSLAVGLTNPIVELAPRALRDDAARWLELAHSGRLPNSADPAAEIRRSLATGPDHGDARAWLGAIWRALYPAIVAKLSGDGLADDQWPAFRRLSAEMERLAFGPPSINAAKLLALIDAGIVDVSDVAGSRPEADLVVDAVMPPPGVPAGESVVRALVDNGYARIAPGRRGVEVSASCECVGHDGSASPGLAAYGRPTEDWVIGNDTLSRSLHPQIDAWAARIVEARVPA